MLAANTALRDASVLSEYAALLGADAPRLVRSYPGILADLSETPLTTLSELAASLGIRRIYAKQENNRGGLSSFKALGGSYAVARLVQQWAEGALGRPVLPEELLQPDIRSLAASRTVTCATDGNHGRSVAAGAKIFGCRAVIFVHPQVSVERLEPIRALGAEIVVVRGRYDDAVRVCTRVSKEQGWHIVSDTSWPGYESVPGYVMQGYTVMVDECVAAFEAAGERPTHVFVQAGVGGLAAAVAAHVTLRWGAGAAKIVVVEPDSANCLLQSCLAGKPIRIPAGESTAMCMLECYEPSHIAWRILEQTVDAFMDIPDRAAVDCMLRLASDSGIRSTESGVAGLAGLIVACHDPEMRGSLGLNHDSSVLVFISEGAIGSIV